MKTKAKKTSTRRKKCPLRERRWLVGLNGGVMTDGSYGFTAKGGVYVMARTRKEALENGRAVMSQMRRAGMVLPDEGLELECRGVKPAGRGPVAELPREIDMEASSPGLVVLKGGASP